jgi:hypothetical protein
MASIKSLYTKERSELPTKLWLTADDYIEIVGMDAEQVQQAELEMHRMVIEYSQDEKLTKKEKQKLKDKAIAHLFAAIIVGWSFEEECTYEAKVELIINSPSLRKRIDEKASEKSNFTKGLQSKSSNTQKPKNGGTARSKTEKA